MVVMIDLASKPRFFIRATMGLGISGVVDLAIGEAI